MTDIAAYLKTPTVAERGIDSSPDGLAAVETWKHHSNAAQAQGKGGPWTVSPTFGNWAWVLNFTVDANGATNRIWPTNDHWDSPGYYDGAAHRGAGVSYAVDATGKPVPYLVPWGPNFQTGVASPGREADPDSGCLIDDTLDAATGWEMLGRHAPSDLEKVALRDRTLWPRPRDGFWGFVDRITGRCQPQFRDGDLVADGLSYRTPANAGRVLGRGAGRIPKRRNIVTKAELDEGLVAHALSVTTMCFNHGPTPVTGRPPSDVDPATRVEHPAGPSNPYGIPAGYVPGSNIRNGQAYALVFAAGAKDEFMASRHLSTAPRRTLGILLQAMETYGWECIETCSAFPQIECSLTTAQWQGHGLTSEVDAAHLLDGIADYAGIVALKPSRGNLPA